jgi:phosphatidate cytidylyltransferase
MISNDLKKRFITSVPLILLLGLSFYYSPILIVSLIILSFISWIEFNGLISKIFKKKNFEIRVYKIFINFISLIYLIIFSSVIFLEITHENLKLNILFLFCVCICSDVGGLLFGKVFKGKKLTKISPNKTISGSIGSFVLSIVLVPVFVLVTNDNNFINIYNLILVSIFVSLVCQIGDLFISFLKRKAKVKDTGNILPGHGGLLDRIDGMLFAIPIGIMILNF